MQTIVDRAESLQEFYGYSSNDLAQTLVSAAGPRSTEWSHEVIIHMENLSEKDVQLYWYGYDGETYPYDHISAGTSILRHTAATHPWEAKAIDDSSIEILIDGLPVYTPGRTPKEPQVKITSKIDVSIKNEADFEVRL